ncbi:DUF2283 domain-containing protein [Microbacterium sp. NPDC055683]
MSVRFDSEADAAYIPVGPGPGSGEAVRQIAGIAGPHGGEIILDFDAGGHLLGIEILGAAVLIRPDVLEGAEVGERLRPVKGPEPR